MTRFRIPRIVILEITAKMGMKLVKMLMYIQTLTLHLKRIKPWPLEELPKEP